MTITTSIQKHGAADIYEHFFDNLVTGTVTTDHAASSYGQPVVLEDGKNLLDYSQIENLTIQWNATDADFATAKTLEAFGVRVTRAMKPLKMEQ